MRAVPSRKHPATSKLRQVPYLGPIRSALLVALIQTPHRFRTKRQLWAYSGLARRARAIVLAATHYQDPKVLLEVSEDLAGAMKGLAIAGIDEAHMLQTRGW